MRACLREEMVVMTDGEPPENSPEPGAAPDASAGGPLGGLPLQPGESPAATAPEPQGDGAVTSTPSGSPLLGRLRDVARGRKAVWAAAAVVCVAAGVIGSLLGAHAVARNDAAKAGQAFPRTSTGISSQLKLAIQHDEDILISASTFFSGNATASAAEFNVWVKWAQMLRRYPELQRLGLVTLVRAPEIAAFQARVTGHVVKPPAGNTLKPALTSRSVKRIVPLATPASVGLNVVPAGTRGFYCLAAVELARAHVRRSPAGLDYCARTPTLLSSRDSALGGYARTSVGHSEGLAIVTPVYRGNLPPSGLVSRRGAFVGWLREVLLPSVVLQQALRGHPGYAVRLRYKAHSSNIVFNSGTAQRGAQSSTVNLHNGWTVRTFGPPPATASVLNDRNALALLIGGAIVSLLLGLLVFLLGGGRSPARAPQARELPHADLYDPLTGLPNRALMMDRAERMLARATRQSGLLVGALFIDIDWFKDVNEKLGEDAGDELLAIVAERLDNVVRAHDTVGRLGGDEFVVLVESAARGARLDSLARRVIEALHKPVQLEGFGPSFAMTASIGVAFGRYASPDDLLRDAQLALRAAQTAGRDRYTLFNANMRSVIEGRGVLEAELNTALQEKQFILLYQPIYDLGTRKVAGFEALLRWRHPKQGILPPEDFVPLAEEAGLIVPIGRWALEEACTRAAAWNVAGHRVGISVEVSPNQLNRDGFATDVRRALQQSGIDPSLLTLEIAETTLMRDIEGSRARLQEIHDMGVRIAVDDFGSGYAEQSDLQLMPLDFLKVDRSSLAASEDEEYRSWLLQAILIVGRELSLTVIATGIQTQEQLRAVQVMGCTMAQGSFMGRPAPADAVESVLQSELPAAPADPTSLAQWSPGSTPPAEG
jgi:diguanylate cyclase (GGDEF)-like protein